MAFDSNLSVARWNAMLDAGLDALDGGSISIYAGPQPATPDSAVGPSTLLGSLALSSPAFSAAVGGTKTANSIASGTAVATGVATWFRAFASDGVTAIIDGSVGTNGPFDMFIRTTQASNRALVLVGSPLEATGWSVSMPVGQ